MRNLPSLRSDTLAGVNRVAGSPCPTSGRKVALASTIIAGPAIVVPAASSVRSCSGAVWRSPPSHISTVSHGGIVLLDRCATAVSRSPASAITSARTRSTIETVSPIYPKRSRCAEPMPPSSRREYLPQPQYPDQALHSVAARAVRNGLHGPQRRSGFGSDCVKRCREFRDIVERKRHRSFA